MLLAVARAPSRSKSQDVAASRSSILMAATSAGRSPCDCSSATTKPSAEHNGACVDADVVGAVVVVPLFPDVVVVLLISAGVVVVLSLPGSPAPVSQEASTSARTPISATERIEAFM